MCRTRRSCAGCCATCRSSRSDGRDTRGLCIRRGGSTKPPSPYEAGGTTSIEQSISMASLWIISCVPIAASTLRRRFFGKAVAAHLPAWPRKINLDGSTANQRALRLLRHEDWRWQAVVMRTRRYLNNIVEQDHRAIKRRCAAMLGFKSFSTAAITLAGVELAHRIHKRQFSFGRGGQRRSWSLKRVWDRALASSHASDRDTGYRLCAAGNAPELRC
jgi:DDE superfamily endonuclease